jgi:small basic protein (TIGR04137 family)
LFDIQLCLSGDSFNWLAGFCNFSLPDGLFTDAVGSNAARVTLPPGQNSHWQRPVRLLQPLPASYRAANFNRNTFMSQHRSLRAASTLGGKRNVLKRFERVEVLKKRGQWKDGDRITGLRKTKPDA